LHVIDSLLIIELQILVNFASWVFPDLKLDWLVRETKNTLPRELNFLLEGENAEKTAGLMKHLPWLHVIKELTCTV
jgi:aarF domain-containing kinase